MVIFVHVRFVYDTLNVSLRYTLNDYQYMYVILISGESYSGVEG